jgi:DNA-directed RNA polymerase specialized sigma24 family protein
MEFYLDYLDELTHEERSVFLYRFILKLPTEQIAKRLRLANKRVSAINKRIKDDIDFNIPIKRIMESFNV